MKFLNYLLGVIGILFFVGFVFDACNQKAAKPDFKRSPVDTVFTSANIAIDVIGGEYRTVTGMKIFYDTTRINPNDSSRVEWYRDSILKVRLEIKRADSTMQTIFSTVDKNLILEDYNKRWPLSIKNIPPTNDSTKN